MLYFKARSASFSLCGCNNGINKEAFFKAAFSTLIVLELMNLFEAQNPSSWGFILLAETTSEPQNWAESWEKLMEGAKKIPGNGRMGSAAGSQCVPLFWDNPCDVLAGCGGIPLPRFVPAAGAARSPPGVGNALARAAGPALATLEGKITIAAGPQARSRARIFLGRSRSARGDPHGGWGVCQGHLGGRGFDLGVCGRGN